MGTDPLAPVRELRQLVDGLHAAGLSVVMQVCHVWMVMLPLCPTTKPL